MIKMFFTPSSTDLLDMIKRAEAKCDADIEQTKLRDQCRAEAKSARRAEQTAAAIAEQRRRQFWLSR